MDLEDILEAAENANGDGVALTALASDPEVFLFFCLDYWYSLQEYPEDPTVANSPILPRISFMTGMAAVVTP